MPRDINTKKPHKTSRPPKAQREAQKAARRNAKKAAQTAASREIAAQLAAQLDGPKGKKPRSNKLAGETSKRTFASRPKNSGVAWGGASRERSDKRDEGHGGKHTGNRSDAQRRPFSKMDSGEHAGKRVGARNGRPGGPQSGVRIERGNAHAAGPRPDKRGERGSTRPGGPQSGVRVERGNAHAAGPRPDKRGERGSTRPGGPQSGVRVERGNARPVKVSAVSGRSEKTASRQFCPTKSSGTAKPSVFTAAVKRARKTMKSPCPVDALCGGCEAIALPYNQQLLLKNAFVADCFEAIESDFELRPILGMENPFRYRNKIISPFAPGKKLVHPKSDDEAGKRKMVGTDDSKSPCNESKHRRKNVLSCEILTGMYEQGTHKLVPTDRCLIENEIGQQVVSAIKAIMERHAIEPYNEDTGEGFMRHVVVRVGHESGEVLVTIVTNEEEFPAGKSFAKELISRVPQVTTVVQNVNMRQTNVILGERESVLYGPGFILDTLCGLSFRISSTSFYQVNASQTEVLYNTAVRLANLTGNQTVIDAYCGTGTIGLVAATHGAKRVIGVESNPAAVRDAWENARHNGIENATFVSEDATEFMRELAQHGTAAVNEFDKKQPKLETPPVGNIESNAQDESLVLLMDPPRAGSTPEFLHAAANLGPSRIVYVSCNPETQVRDIAILQRFGYELQVVQPVDMFPHTSHVETVALLTREDRSRAMHV